MIDQFIENISVYPEIGVKKVSKGFISGVIYTEDRNIKYRISWDNGYVFLRLSEETSYLRDLLAQQLKRPCIKVVHRNLYCKTFLFAWHNKPSERKKFKDAIISSIMNKGLFTRYFGYQEVIQLVA